MLTWFANTPSDSSTKNKCPWDAAIGQRPTDNCAPTASLTTTLRAVLLLSATVSVLSFSLSIEKARKMGGCMSTVSGGGSLYIPNNDGGEEEFHARYLEGDLLGEGEFGAVKLCQDKKAGRDSEELAVKILKKDMTFKDDSALKPQVLQAECDILRTLDGKNYCLELKGIYETPKVIYVVTELCSGGEMMDYGKSISPFKRAQCRRLATHISLL
jgi:hypothetical protein